MSLLILELLRFINKKWKWANYNVTHPQITNIYIDISKKIENRDSLKIVMMSDLHIGEMIDRKLVERYVALSNAQNPDMVVLAGDIMDYESRFAEKEHIEDVLKQLKAPLGIYIIMGNHEYRANRLAKERWLKKTGGILCQFIIK